MELDLSRIVPDPSRTIRAGALAPWSTPAYHNFLQALVDRSDQLDIPVDSPFESLREDEVKRLVEGVAGSGFTGLKAFFRGLEGRAYKRNVRVFLNRWRRYQTCPACRGARLRPEALAVKIAGRDFASLSALTIRDARAFLLDLDDLRRQPVVASILAQIDSRLGYLAEIGLDYVTLDRSASSLSPGELQRISLTKTLGSGLVNTLYVLDEPSLGIHPRDVETLIRVLHRLRDQGNTLVVVEHDHDVIRSSDHIVDLGPGAGAAGGQILYSGPFAAFTQISGSPTSEYLSRRKQARVSGPRRPLKDRSIRLVDARGNNLKSINVVFPLNVVSVVTGLSGAGKSTLIEETLYPAPPPYRSRP